MSLSVWRDGPLIFDPEKLQSADHMAILVPGAFSQISIFSHAEDAFNRGTALAFYRLPGLDGMPLQPGLSIDQAARDIAEFVDNYTDKSISLIGYSLGAAVILAVRQYMVGSSLLKLALISPSPECAGGIRTSLLAIRDIVHAAWRAAPRSRQEIWYEYWQLLLFGRTAYASEERANEAKRLLEENLEEIILPSNEMRIAHTNSIKKWRVPHHVPDANSQVGIFFGEEDPVFSRRQTDHLIGRIKPLTVVVYPGQGHLLCISEPSLFEDISSFIKGNAP